MIAWMNVISGAFFSAVCLWMYVREYPNPFSHRRLP